MFRRRGWILSGLIAVVLLGSVLWLRWSPDLSRLWPVNLFFEDGTLVFTGVGLGVLATAAILAAAWWSSPWHHPIFAALGVTTALIPGIATVATAAIYLARAHEGSAAFAWEAVLLGMLAAFYGWWLLALLYRRFVSVQCANPRIYRELSWRLDELNVHLDVLKPLSTASMIAQSAYGEACAHRDFISETLGRDPTRPTADTGFHWVFATGYIDLWNRLHRAEEALIQLKPAEAVISGGRYDQWRLQHSNMENSSELLKKLTAALGTWATDREHANAARPAEAGGTAAGRGEEWARAVLREVRHALNEYRDGRWEGLVRVRNRLIKTGTFTSLFTYLLLCLAIVAGAGPQAVMAAAAFYLVGVSVGLFNQLLAEAGTESAIEDYGLASTRLLHIPLFSGFAAVGGVVLMTLLPLALTPEGQRPPRGETAALERAQAPANQAPLGDARAGLEPQSLTPSAPGVVGKLRQIFDLQSYPLGLVIAAVFGLTPRLLIDGLKSQTDRYSRELKTTQATSGMKSEEG